MMDTHTAIFTIVNKSRSRNNAEYDRYTTLVTVDVQEKMKCK